jgi:hypothetical protein
VEEVGRIDVNRAGRAVVDAIELTTAPPDLDAVGIERPKRERAADRVALDLGKGVAGNSADISSASRKRFAVISGLGSRCSSRSTG